MSNINPTAMHELAEKVLDHLVKKGFNDFMLYVNNESWSPYAPELFNRSTATGTGYHATENVDVTKYVSYCNPDTISLTFEGPLYDEINYGNGHLLMELWDILDNYDLYFERGTYYSLLAYEG